MVGHGGVEGADGEFENQKLYVPSASAVNTLPLHLAAALPRDVFAVSQKIPLA
jgi:hypothetical protein